LKSDSNTEKYSLPANLTQNIIKLWQQKQKPVLFLAPLPRLNPMFAVTPHFGAVSAFIRGYPL